MSEKHRTGAATFEIHMLANVATNMLARMTFRGLEPTRARIFVASFFAM